MDATNNEPIPAACDYCGRENPDRLTTCTGCGTPLTQNESKGKSKGLAYLLALLLPAIALFYVGAWKRALILIFTALLLRATHFGGLWFIVGVRIICVYWVYRAFAKQNEAPNADVDWSNLLDEAARLESVDRAKAIEAYEEIIRLHPDTSASRESARNIQTLKLHL